MRPLLFFGLLGLLGILAGLGFGAFVVNEFTRTGLVLHPSTAVLAVACILAGTLSLATGLILDTVNRRSQEILRLVSDQLLAKDRARP